MADFFLEHLDAGQSSRNVSVLSDMTSKIWADFAKDWRKIGILQ